MSFSKLLVAAFLNGAVAVLASPRDDLASTSQQTRDEAARVLRATFVTPSRERWDALVIAIKPGDTRNSVLERLRPFNTSPEMGNGSGQSFTESYRLDDVWMLTCSFVRRDSGEFVFRAELREQVHRISFPPPANFTGVWTTYYVNG